MDATQFKQFMETFAASQSALLQGISSLQITPAVVPVSTTNIPSFEPFNDKNEKFKNYLERFETFLSVRNIVDDSKKAQLLSVSIGSQHYNNLSALLGPETPIKNLTYSELKVNFNKLLAPRRNIVVSQHYFLNTYQKENQTIAQFVASLQQDISECEFTAKCDCNKEISAAEIFLRAQFIRGLKDNWIREQLLQLNAVSFQEFQKKAIALEASRLETNILAKQSQQTLEDNGINKVSQSKTNHSCSRSKLPFTSNRNFLKSHSYNSKYKNKSSIDYRRLGINNLCFKCGRNNHKASECRTSRSSLKCRSCGKQGHTAKVCISTLLQQHSTHYVTEDSDQEHNYGLNIVDIFDIPSNGDLNKYLVIVSIKGTSVKFEVDSGAGFTLLPEDIFNKLKINAPLESTNVNFRTYTKQIFKPIGKITIEITYQGRNSMEEIYVVPAGHPAILGRIWIRHLKINLSELDSFQGTQHTVFYNSNPLEDVLTRYSNVFKKVIGCIPNYTASLKLRDGATPVYTRERNVPFALRAAVEAKLIELETNGIITKIDACDWGSPLVVIPKENGDVRLCVDYKVGVNEKLVNSNYPIRTIPEVLNNLRNSKYFCKLDIFNAFLHIPVDSKSSQIQAITTHKGTYAVNRISFGIKVGPAEFNKVLDKILQGLPKTEAYFDDLIVHGSTKEECLTNLEVCLNRLQKFNLHLNKDKCKFLSEKIDYLGHVIEHNKISKSPDKVRAITEMSRPKNVGEVRRFLGMVTYYSRFIQDLSTKTTTLRNLLCRNKKFSWTYDCEMAFRKLKEELCSDRILVPYDPNLPIVLTCDASPTGIAAIMSHVVDDEEKPIAFASRSLTSSECNYSQLDREALSIIYSVGHFHNYLYGKEFLLVTDNEALSRIFHPKKPLPVMTSARLLRYAAFLSGFNYSVKFKRGEENANVDCLSRAPVNIQSNSIDAHINQEVHVIHMESIMEISSITITAAIIAKETELDDELRKIKTAIQKENSDLPYTIDDGVLFKNNRVVIPKKLQGSILQELHATHIGITKMKQLARRYVYWQGIDSAIENMVKSCEQCALIKSNPSKVPLHPWGKPDSNWERIHIDYAGPFEGYFFLICVDAKSKWMEVKHISTAPTTSNTIKLLENIFASHGYPQTLVSDNATVFKSCEFQEYCHARGIFQKFIAPGHPATNGLAERNVQTIKNRLKTQNNTKPIHLKLQEILFKYRATPLNCGRSPAELYLGRQLRIKLDALRPYHPSKNAVQYPNSSLRSLKVGERVQGRNYKNNKQIWEFGIVTARLGALHYNVQLDSGRIIKRHINQLRSTQVKKIQIETPFPKYPDLPLNISIPTPTPLMQPAINATPEDDAPQQPHPTDESCQIRRSNRKCTRPAYLEDYVTKVGEDCCV